jgi:uncharacterized phage protein (predicted DNA packaging)
MPLLDDIKTVMRISNIAFDSELNDLIASARQDLILSGVTSEKANLDTDPLIKRAVSTYVKANFGWDNPDADRLNKSFEMLKQHLSLSQEYSLFTVTFAVTDGTGPLEDATVTFNDLEKITNSSGEAVFMGIAKQQNMKYLVTLDGYEDVEGTVDVEGSLSVSVSMTAVV